MTQTLDILKLGSRCMQALAAQGISVEMSTDFVASEAIVREMGKPGIKAILSADFNDFTHENAFWLLMKEGDTYVAAIAARLDDVGRESIQSYMKRILDRQYPTDKGASVASITGSLPHDFYGRMVHVGELFVRPNARGSRKRLRQFMWMFHATAAAKWTIDWSWAFMKERDVLLGAASFYGFTTQVPDFVKWTGDVPEGRGATDWVILMDQTQLHHQIRYLANSLEGL